MESAERGAFVFPCKIALRPPSGTREGLSQNQQCWPQAGYTCGGCDYSRLRITSLLLKSSPPNESPSGEIRPG
jgi:hypothetical protein